MKLPPLRSRTSLAILWGILTAAVSVYLVLPNRSLPEVAHFDDICRFSAFAVLSFLPFLAFPRLRNAIYLSLFMAILGLTLEQYRQSVPGRHYSVANMLINDSGVILGFAIGMLLRYSRRDGKKPQLKVIGKER